MLFTPVRARLASVLFAGSLLLAVAGCGGGSDTSQVTGVVKFEGAAVPTGKIAFHPVEGGRPSTGRLDANGGYRLSTMAPGDGAKPGDYKVTITAVEVTGAAAGGDPDNDFAATGPAPKRTWIVPEEYSNIGKSGLTATVKPGSNTIDFDLP